MNYCEHADLDLTDIPKAFRKDPGLSIQSLEKSKRNHHSVLDFMQPLRDGCCKIIFKKEITQSWLCIPLNVFTSH